MIAVSCAACGVEFGLTDDLHARRRKDGQAFVCPNGHSNVYQPSQDEKRIAELEKRIRLDERVIDEWRERWNGIYSQRENLIGALKECIVPGCAWRSRRQISRDDVHMGRGIERARRDLIEHLVHDHGAGGHVADRPRLEQRTPDEPIEAEVVDA